MTRMLLATAFSIGVALTNAQGNETRMEAELREAFARGELRGLHAVHAIFRGEVIADIYFEGADQNWGVPLGVRQHGPDTLHDLRSVSKSITGLLYGIALDQGLVPPVSERLIDQFPEYPDLADDPMRRAITIEDALTMQMGIEWNEDLPYTDPRNGEIAMELSDDRVRYVLSRPMVEPPGKTWVYNGGATAVVARLIEKGSGMPLDHFAEEALFAPLGITRFEWARGNHTAPAAASGLRLSVRSLVTIGQMLRAKGMHEGNRIVSEDWIRASMVPHTINNFGLRYGYFWWLTPGTAAPRWMAGFGNGGQRLTVNHVDDLILVIMGGRYNEPDNWKLPVKVIEDFVVPAIIGKD